MLLASGQLPDVGVCAPGEAAQLECAHAALEVVVKRIVQAGEGRLIQDGGTYELVFEILVDISDALCKFADLRGGGIRAAYSNGPREVADDELGDEPVHRLAKR